MNTMKKRSIQRSLRARRTRAKIQGTAERPRLSVFRSSKHITAQMIDDIAGRTLAASDDANLETAGKKGVEIAALVGADIAAKAKKAGINTVIFDRGSYRYHGRVKALAEAARETGLEF